MWALLIVALAAACAQCSAEVAGTYENDNKLDEAAALERENLTSNVFVLPEQIFNDGKPFYVKKDPISGTLDYTAKTTPESLPVVPTSVATEPEVRPTNQTIEISSTIGTSTSTSTASTVNSTSDTVTNSANDGRRPTGGEKHDIVLDENVRGHSNFHDFLNLPVKYQSSKFVYPLVSSSYANLKYQGNNKNFLSNHKLDSSTSKTNVPYALSHTKKYKTTYPTKSYGTSTMATATDKRDTVPESDATTRTPSPTTRRYANIPSRGSGERRYTTVSRSTSTTPRTPTTSSYEVKFNRRRGTTTTTSTTTTTTTTTTPASTTADEPKRATQPLTTVLSTVAASVPAPTNATNPVTLDDNEKDESMNFGDFFSYFFNNEENGNEAKGTPPPSSVETTVGSAAPKPAVTTAIASTAAASTATPPTQRPVTVTTSESIRFGPYSHRYNLTLNSATRKPYNRTELSVDVPPFIEMPSKMSFASTASPLIGDFGSKSVAAAAAAAANDGKFRPLAHSVNSIHGSAGSNGAAVVTNGHVSTVVTNSQTNQIAGQFQPPAQSSMSNIIVLPDSNSASVVATSKLQTASDNPRRPASEKTELDETTKPGITFFTKGHVTSADAYDNVNANRINYRGPPAPASSNIIVGSGTNTASFGIASQMTIGTKHEQPERSNGTQIKFEDDAKEPDSDVYTSNGLSTQRPQGFLLPSTTSKAVKTVLAQSAGGDSAQFADNQVRFPSEVTADQPFFDSNTDKPIKFPLNPLPQIHSQAIPIEGGTIIKFNEITDAIDLNGFKQPMLAPANALPINNYVVFRPQQPIAIQPPAVLMAPIHLAEMTRPPAILRNTPPFMVKKPTFIHYARKNFTGLPNILPQFRPSPPPQPQHIALSPELVNQIRQGQLNRPQFLYNTQTVRFKPTIPFHYTAQRLITPMQMPNRRHYELYPANFNQRLYDQRIGPHLVQRSPLPANALLVEPHRFEDTMKLTSGEFDILKTREPIPDKLLVQSIVESKPPKVEPVTTLQMIHHQRQVYKVQPGGAPVNGMPGDKRPSNATDPNAKTDQPLYVVYPMQKSAMTAGMSKEHRGNGEIATILADQVHGRPIAAHQQHGLPHTIEKTKSRYILNSRPVYELDSKKAEQTDAIAADNDEEDSEHPIAIAYSPTEPSPSLADVYRPTPAHHRNTPVFVTAVSEAKNPNANQQFEAPFIPSINLENTQSTHNGWLVVTPPSPKASDANAPKPTEAKANVISASLANANSNATSSFSSRSDDTDAVESATSADATTKKFDINSFKPNFESGFQPIVRSSKATDEPPTPKQHKSSDEQIDRSDISFESLFSDDVDGEEE